MARRPTPEKLYQGRVQRELLRWGYLGIHVYPLRSEDGFITPGPPGWPDLVYLRTPRVLAIEVKADGVKVPPHQLAWLTLWASIPCARAMVVRPSDPPWETLVSWIRRPADAPSPYGFAPIEEDPHVVLAQHKRQKRRKEPTR